MQTLSLLPTTNNVTQENSTQNTQTTSSSILSPKYKIIPVENGCRIDSKYSESVYVLVNKVGAIVCSVNPNVADGTYYFDNSNFVFTAEHCMGVAKKIVGDSKDNVKKYRLNKVCSTIYKRIKVRIDEIVEQNFDKRVVGLYKAAISVRKRPGFKHWFNEEFIKMCHLISNTEYLYREFFQYRTIAPTLMWLQFIEGKDVSLWRHRICYNGVMNRSIHKTIENFPGNLPAIFIAKLCFKNEVIDSRVKLICWYFARTENWKKVILKSSDKELRNGLRLFCPGINLRKFSEIMYTIVNITDFEILNDKISFKNACEQSLRWHRQPILSNRNQYPGDTKLAVPQFEFDNKFCKRLETVEELNNESVNMRHCVASYAKKCIDGKSFIYHVEYKKTSATLELDCRGNLMQVSGPHNSSNEACRYIQKFLHNKTKVKINDEMPF